MKLWTSLSKKSPKQQNSQTNNKNPNKKAQATEPHSLLKEDMRIKKIPVEDLEVGSILIC